MPSSYLFLSEKQRDGLKWNNLPTLSQSTRECYLTVIDCKVLIDDAVNRSVVLKMKMPSLNYFSSDNTDVIVSFLKKSNTRYSIDKENQISILTNDNLKSVEFILEDLVEGNEAIDLENVGYISIMLKLDYVDQDSMVNQVLLEYPKHLK